MLFLPLALIRVLYKSIKSPKYLVRLSERFALNPKLDSELDLWIHTVSVGEFLAAKSLIQAVVEKNPSIKLLITTTTVTGSELVQKYINEAKSHTNAKIYHVYYPYDVAYFCHRFLKNIKPSCAVFFETEIWPRMFTAIKKHEIKLFIINARLSEKSFRGYSKIKSYIGKTLNKVDYIAAQSDLDQKRFMALGCDSNKISVFGNIKYNLKLPEDLKGVADYYKSLFGDARKVFIAASTHAGEDEIILEVFKKIRKAHSNLLLVLVPRHPERFEKVYNLCSNDFNTVKYTDFNHNNNLPKNTFDSKDILLVDTIGKLLYFYAIADIAFVGGSLVNTGGHNPLEPALLSLPTIMGPHYHNFATIVAELRDSNAIKIAHNNTELQAQLEELLNDKELRLQIGKAAEATFEHHKGILEKYLQLLNLNKAVY